MTKRRLPECYQVNIKIETVTYNNNTYRKVTFFKSNDTPVSNHFKLTPSQWERCQKYIERSRVPFCTYDYKAKNTVKDGIYKIR